MCIPNEIRLGKRYSRLKNFLKNAQWWTKDKIENWQTEHLREVITNAYLNVPGYFELCQAKRIKPEDLRTKKDIIFFPFMDKKVIRDNLKDFTTRTIPKRRMVYSSTGGSTGIPLFFYKTASCHGVENAFMHTQWAWIGWKPWMKCAVLKGGFVGSSKNFWKYRYDMNAIVLSSHYLSSKTYESYIEKIEKISPQYLRAYPSNCERLASLLIEHGDIGRINFKFILLSSENIYDWQKKRIEEAFPKSRIFSWYGHGEMTVLAPWCESDQAYHSWPFYGILEMLDTNDKEVEFGEIGEIIGTSFWNLGTPFIRYRTMDYARKISHSCPKCGRNFVVFNDLQGRKQEMAISKSGRLISIASLSLLSPHMQKVKQFQFHQNEIGIISLNIIPKTGFQKCDMKEIETAANARLGKDFIFKINIVDFIKSELNGKFKFMDQELDIGKEVTGK